MYKNESYWNTFYSNSQTLYSPSPFCQSEYLKGYLPKDYILVELGCGAGADSLYFSQMGFDVIAVDGSEVIIKKNQNTNIEFLCKNLGDNEEVEQLFYYINEIANKKKKKILIYTRFFFHAITEDVEDLLISMINEILGENASVVSEFRVREDEKLYKVYDNHYRRYIDTNIFIKKIINRGFDISKFDKNRGFSPYKDEDPYICRIEFKK